MPSIGLGPAARGRYDTAVEPPSPMPEAARGSQADLHARRTLSGGPQSQGRTLRQHADRRLHLLTPRASPQGRRGVTISSTEPKDETLNAPRKRLAKPQQHDAIPRSPDRDCNREWEHRTAAAAAMRLHHKLRSVAGASLTGSAGWCRPFLRHTDTCTMSKSYLRAWCRHRRGSSLEVARRQCGGAARAFAAGGSERGVCARQPTRTRPLPRRSVRPAQ